MIKVERNFQERPTPISPAPVWEDDFPGNGEQTLAFKRWFLSKVLMRGAPDDLRAAVLDTFHSYLGELNLSTEIRRFWK
jgi:hypothetical protein